MVEVPQPLTPGTRLGKYEVLRLIGTGGMAEVHLARARGIEGFEKLVVLKRLLPQLAGDGDLARMFLDEARLAATLHHPNIAQVYDIGIFGSAHFFAMEYVHGADLTTILRRARRIGLEHALGIVAGLAAGLHYAHEKTASDGTPLRIVHRDVSPENVLVTFDGCVKVVDFGIAKAAQRDTVTGGLRGKVEYMSPEQCRALPLDRRSDVFAVGILLYELTTGKRLFRGPSFPAVLQQITSGEIPPPSSRREGYPPELERIVLKALARDPSERYPTALDMQADVEEFARERKLAISPITLARFMNGIFDEEITAWRRARRVGRTLVEHVSGVVPERAASAHARPPRRLMRWGIALGLLLIAAAVASRWIVREPVEPAAVRDQSDMGRGPRRGMPLLPSAPRHGVPEVREPATARSVQPSPPASPATAGVPEPPLAARMPPASAARLLERSPATRRPTRAFAVDPLPAREPPPSGLAPEAAEPWDPDSPFAE